MTNLAIRGDIIRGNEVIEILEMLGGNNVDRLTGIYDHNECAYVIDSTNKVEIVNVCRRTDTYIVFTLEEFLEKHPFKVGDIVHILEYESEVRICKMRWCECGYVEYLVHRCDVEEWYTADELLEYNTEFLIDEDNKITWK